MAEEPLVRIARIGRRMAWLTTTLFWALVPLLGLYVLLLPEQLAHHGMVAGAGFQPRTFPLMVGLAVWAALTVISLPALWGLWALKGLFQGYAQGAIFTVAAAGRLRHCGLALVVAGLQTPFASMLLSGALSLDLPKGSRMLVLSLSGNDVVLLVIGALILTIAHVMGEAVRMAEENAEFI